ncbi:hypothetical protein [Leeuwenhoekiella sp. W20_SRS_FM14]|uniref:hypothetical protein n=1 Tax=Leeuwenhoekiella sp. W20_SRS_FM14 TaxID=3240270 RepID=UPI003F99E683
MIPRITTSQRNAILSPANGLLLYNTNLNSIEINTGTPTTPVWKTVELKERTTNALIPPSVTTLEMNALATIEGSIVYNTDFNCLFQYNGSWSSLCKQSNTKKVTLYKNFNGDNVIIANAAFHNFPFGSNPVDIKEIDSDTFEILGDGSIRVLQAGSYFISASLAVRNMNSGNRKYILAVFEGTTRRGYMSRGFTNVPTGNDYFGVSGVFQYYFNANAIINIQYYFNTPTTTFNGDLMHIGIVKL